MLPGESLQHRGATVTLLQTEHLADKLGNLHLWPEQWDVEGESGQQEAEGPGVAGAGVRWPGLGGM